MNDLNSPNELIYYGYITLSERKTETILIKNSLGSELLLQMQLMMCVLFAILLFIWAEIRKEEIKCQYGKDNIDKETSVGKGEKRNKIRETLDIEILILESEWVKRK